MNTQRSAAYVAALIYTLIIGFSFIFVKLALIDASPLDILAHRFTLSFLMISVLVRLGWVKLNMRWRGELLSILPLALFYPVLFFTFQAFGLVYTTSSEAGIIQATIPIFTMVLAAYFLKERSTYVQLAATLVSVLGVMFIFVMKGLDLNSSSLLGSVLILLCALSSAAYNVMARKLGGKWDVMTLTYVMTVIGFLLFNVLSFGQHLWKGTLSSYFTPFLHPAYWGAVLFLGILSSLVTSYLSNYVLSKIEASQMSVFANLATLISIIAGIFVLGEELQGFHIVGGVLILIGVVGRNMLPAKRRSSASKG